MGLRARRQREMLDRMESYAQRLEAQLPGYTPTAGPAPFQMPDRLADYGAYMDPTRSAAYVQNLEGALGVPETTALKQAQVEALERGVAGQRRGTDAAMASRGLYTSGAAGSAQDAITRDIYAPALAGIEQSYSDRLMEEANRRLGMASGFGQGAAGFNLARSQEDLARAQAQFGSGLAGQQFAANQNLLGYQAQMLPWQIAQGTASQPLPGGQATASIMGGALGAAGQLGGAALMAPAAACWVAEELFGRDHWKTHAARFYAKNVDTPFTIAYREHGKKWAEHLKENPELKPLWAPIWEEMAKEGAKMARSMAA